MIRVHCQMIGRQVCVTLHHPDIAPAAQHLKHMENRNILSELLQI
jgi:hypothetical protein